MNAEKGVCPYTGMWEACKVGATAEELVRANKQVHVQMRRGEIYNATRNLMSTPNLVSQRTD